MAKVFKMLQSFITNAQDVFAQEGYKKVIFVWKSSMKRGI